jgi:hypothetical protein
VFASSKYGDAVDVASRAAKRSGWAGKSHSNPSGQGMIPAGVGVQGAPCGVDQLGGAVGQGAHVVK